jgi:CDP-diacylglycerol--glycerol-3-phosphate 3-phosphatidyltransferase
MSLPIYPELNSRNLNMLRRKWFFLLILQIVLLIVVTWLLVSSWNARATYQWLVLASFCSVLYFWYLWIRLDSNHSLNDSHILPTLGPGNLLTIVRGMLLMLLAGFMFTPMPQGGLGYLPGILYACAAISDLFDGYLARISNQQTRLGEQLDMSLDGLGLLIASFLLVWYGQVPIWYLLVGLARYLFLIGIWLRKLTSRPVFPLAENSARRPFAGAQMGFAAVMLFPVFSPPGTNLAATLFALPFLTGFLFDWFTVSGYTSSFLAKQDHDQDRKPGASRPNHKIRSTETLRKWVPLTIRLILVILLAYWLIDHAEGLIESFNSAAFNQHLVTFTPAYWISLLLMIASGLILIGVGIAGRVATLLVLFGIGMYLEVFRLGLMEILIVFASIALFYLGTGTYSLWIPELKIITRRLGEL